jgi:hypothetical protein
MTNELPGWLVASLINAGAMTSDRVTIHAKPRRCPRCRLFCLVGLDDVMRAKTTVDFLATTAAGELFALLTERKSYGLDNRELYWRTPIHIQHKSADVWPVHIQHVCDSPLLPINPLFMPTISELTKGEPPF